MPKVDGIELLKEIKKQAPELNVVMVSGHGNIHTAVTATKFGAFDFIEKPVSLEGLLLTVRRALGELSVGKTKKSNSQLNNRAKGRTRGGASVRRGNARQGIKQKTLRKRAATFRQRLHT